MRSTGIIALLVAVGLLVFGCGERAASNASTDPATAHVASDLAENQKTMNVEAITASNTAAKPRAASTTTRQVLQTKVSLDQTRTALIDTAPTDRKIIRHADLNLEAESPEEIQHRITSIAETNGGFVVESQQSSTDNRSVKRDTVTMSIRVPAQKFGDTLNEIRNAAQRVISETVKGDDVTEEFIDVEARLKAKKALEQQFVEIMRRAHSVDDALSVQYQLAEVRGDVERVEGRKRFLENQASLSTIKVRVQTAAAFSASASGVSNRFGQSFATGMSFALDFVLGLVTFLIAVLPIALIIGLPAFLVTRYFWRRQSRPKSVAEIARDELTT